MKWIHHFGVDDFDAMTNVGKALREKLKASAEIRGPEIVSQDISADGTRKWVVRVASGRRRDRVYPQGGRGTLCVSSQAGCALDCSFCSTGKQGFNSDLTAAEVIGQVWIANKSFGGVRQCVETVYIPRADAAPCACPPQAGCALDCSFCSTGKRGFNSDLTAAEVIGQVWIANKSFGTVPAKIDRAITNVVMMGMGEPLLNFDNVVAAMNIMMDDLGYGISKRR